MNRATQQQQQPTAQVTAEAAVYTYKYTYLPTFSWNQLTGVICLQQVEITGNLFSLHTHLLGIHIVKCLYIELYVIGVHSFFLHSCEYGLLLLPDDHDWV